MMPVRRAFVLVAMLVAPLLVLPSAVVAQASPAESAAVLLRTATDFEARGEWDIAEALLEHIIEQYPNTPAAQQALARLNAPEAAREQRVSRLELPVFGTLYGMWLGVAVPSAFDADDSEAYGIGLLAGVPIGLFSSLAAQRSQQYTEGQARAITWGGTWGTWQGLGWAEVLGFGTEEVCGQFGCYDSGDNGQEVLTTMIFGGLAGIATGAVIARNPVRSGVASAAQGGGTWGSIYGAMVAEILDDDDGDDDAVLLASILAGNAGLLVGEVLGSRYDVSRPRVRLMNLGALGGGLMGLGIDLLADPGDNALIAIPLATSVAGLTIATLTTRDRDRAGSENAEAGDAGMALFGYSDAGLTMNTPLPMPTMLRFEDADGRDAWTPGVRLELFRARFW